MPLLLKKMNGFNALITGLPKLDESINFNKKCKTYDQKNCIYPMFTGAIEGHVDLACLADSTDFSNQPK